MTSQSPVVCPVCSSSDVTAFFSIQELPTLSVALWPDEETARSCPRGEITLSGCRSCAFIENVNFEPELIEYDAKYENALHFSGVYRQYAQTEAEALIKRHGLRGKHIVEIGCGDGQFLSELCRLGGNTGTGYDPSFVPDAKVPLAPGVTVEQRYFTGEDVGSAPDLILCRQVLEHIPDPSVFIRTLRDDLEGHPGTMLSFEVPNAEHLIRNLSVWDLTYEHCSYFTAPALGRLFELCGFSVHDIREGFGGQNLTIEASPGDRKDSLASGLNPETSRRIDAVAVLMAAFSDEASARISRWGPQLKEWGVAGRRVALWGAGARSAMFLAATGASEAVGCLVDINPRKHGSFMPGTSLEIQAPQVLPEYNPETVLLMNAIYQEEVGASLRELGLKPKLVVP